MSNPNANVRKFDGAVNAAAYWIYDHLLRAGDIVNDSTVTGTTVKEALNTLNAANSVTRISGGTTGIVPSTLTSGDVTIGVGTTATNSALTLVSRDTNSNMSANNLSLGFNSVATAGGTTQLAASSAATQYYTGTLNQIVRLPNTATLAPGHRFTFVSSCTGTVNVQTSSGADLTPAIVISNTQTINIICVSAAGLNTDAEWISDVAGPLVTRSLVTTTGAITSSLLANTKFLSTGQKVGSINGPGFAYSATFGQLLTTTRAAVTQDTTLTRYTNGTATAIVVPADDAKGTFTVVGNVVTFTKIGTSNSTYTWPATYGIYYTIQNNSAAGVWDLASSTSHLAAGTTTPLAHVSAPIWSTTGTWANGETVVMTMNVFMQPTGTIVSTDGIYY